MKVERLALIGCGLMGGSFALALRQAGKVASVAGYSASEATRTQARELGILDQACDSIAQAVQGADLVLLAVPVRATAACLQAMQPALSAQALVMDVGSTKGDVVQAARAQLGERLANFVPAHPIAGKEVAGIAHADALLYRERRCILTPLADNSPALLAKAEQVWQAVGCHVSRMSPETHDATFAAVSHLPHLLAFATLNGLTQQANHAELLAMAGPGFRDFTRIAASAPEVWRDILHANQAQVLHQLTFFQSALADLEQALHRGDAEALQTLIARASQARAGWHLQSGHASPES